ncbi:MAG: hypothetical protein JWR11_2858 [Mycobacterium sp.]|jgi:uncharacterized protein (UPF0303 family)|nr:hypothetical protein [Mycobacterium sp.]MDT5065894.1 hypothetical protein [Mycobacterium sp.]MDT5181744.1 hypothetical protein [Mycobacterium sp.]
MDPTGDATDFWRETYEKVSAEEKLLDFDRFSYADAWALGSAMVVDAMECRHAIAIAIVFGEQRVFHAALEGSAATNDDWLARKFRAVYRHNCSSWALECQQRAMGGDYYSETGYHPADIALTGGAVPLRVRSSLIGAIGVSGLAAEEDHYFAFDAMSSYAQLPAGHDDARLPRIGTARKA